MSQLRIMPIQARDAAFAEEKGKLFEKVVCEVLRREGYEITARPRVNYAGMELDIEGVHSVSGVPFIAECKAHETLLDAPAAQKFVGKYWNRWYKDKKLHGIVVAVPGLNSHAKPFFEEAAAVNPDATLILLEDEDIIARLQMSNLVASPASLADNPVRPDNTMLGDHILLATEVGYFWLQLLIESGHTVPSLAFVVDARGQALPEGDMLRALAERIPELEGVKVLAAQTSGGARLTTSTEAQLVDEVAGVTGSSSWFEYQFPASPQFFAGRLSAIAEAGRFADEIRAGATSHRGLLIQGYSGWGKSSLILKLREALAGQGCLVTAIDCRAAATPYFALRAVDHALRDAITSGLLTLDGASVQIGGMSSLRDVLTRVSDRLRTDGRLMCIAFDQFEGLFGSPLVLENVARLASIVTELSGRILLFFAWKTDLVGLTQEFPFATRDEISGRCRTITVDRFGETETAAVLQALEIELHTRLRRDLAFLLREASQGYPWLLKKLCAHVLSQREAGVTQIQLATQMLRVKELFDEDLAGLSPQEEHGLRHIARVAPAPFAEVTESVPVEVLSPLIDKRLVIRVANKCDIYWDIFKDYLNTGTVPVDESFILRSPIGSVISALVKIRDAGEAGVPLAAEALAIRSQGTFYNVVRDAQLLGLIRTHENRALLTFSVPSEGPIEPSAAAPLQDKLRRHRIVRRLLGTLEESGSLPVSDVARMMEEACPYVTADHRTWSTYARILVSWLGIAQMVALDRRSQTLRRFDPETDLRTNVAPFLGFRRQTAPFIPEVQYQRIEAAMLDIGDAIAGRQSQVTLKRLSMNAWSKAVRVAAALGLIDLTGNVIRVTEAGQSYIANPELRHALFGDLAARNLPAYAEFLRILRDPRTERWSLCKLGQELARRLGTTWRESTATWRAKILNNWAKASGAIPQARRPLRRRASSGRLWE